MKERKPLRCFWRSARGDEGMSIVEVLVAMTVFSVGILAIFATTDSSFKVATGTTHRARATAVATKSIEDARSIPYDKLALTTTVVPTSETIGGSTFDVSRIVEEVTPTGGTSEKVKKVTVLVEWDDASGGHDLSQATYVYPSGPSVTTTTVGAGALPLAPVLNTVTNVDGTVMLNWTPPSTGGKVYRYVVRRAVNSWATGPVWTVTQSEPPDSTSFLLSGLAASTTYLFEVGAVAANGSVVWSGDLSTMTSASTSVDCKVASTSVTPETVERVSPYPSPLAVTPTITVETSGTCTGFNATYEASDGSEVVTPLAPTTVGGQVWAAQVSNSGFSTWQVGSYRVEITDNLTNHRGSADFTVCESGSACA